ncbi:MAG: hypothetical protein EA379_05625 [Phycisphaerales bacterium]|nr:MAG: hypothetical protein EA379_05625 [Phycisphaerales bacterium]
MKAITRRIALFALSFAALTALLVAPATLRADETEAPTHFASGPRSFDNWVGSLRTVESMQMLARRHNVLLNEPRFERTPERIERNATLAMREADRRLKRLARVDLAPHLGFDGTMGAYEDILSPVRDTMSRFYLLREVSPDAAIRDAATEQVRRLSEWFVGLQYREDVHTVLSTFGHAYEQGMRPPLNKEGERLVMEILRDYRRAGMELDKETREKVEALQLRLTSLSTDFGTNITQATRPVEFAADELAGVPEGFLRRVGQNDEGGYTLDASDVTHFLAVMNNASNEDARRRMKIGRFTVAQDTNTDVLNKLVATRDEIASLLGYQSWADYQTETRMARTGARATAFVANLIQRLEPKFKQELEAMRRLKADDTGDANARIHIWDWRYYENEIKKRRFDIDTEALRAYFPLDASLRGMFGIYEEIFGLSIERVDPSWTWHEDVGLYAVSDSASGAPLGLFYLDLFPREGKFGHFAQFGITKGRMERSNEYRRPVVALVCNFNPPTDDTPSLLSHSELETLFHEFGHAMHSILTQAQYGRFSGTSVPRDFVEAPSQMLENWCWDIGVLNRFAGHYRDSSRTLDPAVLERMREARLATVATFYRRQLAFALGDLVLHAPGPYKDAQTIINGAMAGVFLPVPEGTHFGAAWGHLTGYDAGYYGYAWADVIAADMATAFEDDPEGFMSAYVGMRLRNEVYAVGGTRDANDTIEAFLGRRFNNEAFLRSIGVAE